MHKYFNLLYFTSYCWQVHDVYPVVTWNAQDFPLYIFPRWTTYFPQMRHVDSPMGWCFEKWLFPWVDDSTFFTTYFPQKRHVPRCSWWLVNPPFQEVYRGIAASLEKLGLGSFLIRLGQIWCSFVGRNPSTNITLAPHPSLACNWICSVWVSQVCGYWILPFGYLT